MTGKYEIKLIDLVEEIAKKAEETGLGGFTMNSKETYLFSKIMQLKGYVEILKDNQHEI